METVQLNGEKYLKHLMSDDGLEPIDKDAEKIELELPQYYDAELFKRGQKVFYKYANPIITGMLIGLIAVLAIPSILRVLIWTRKSGTPMDAYRRYTRTLYHAVSWHEFEPKPGTKAWQSLTMVRKTHFAARKSSERAENITITQRDMALTQFAFIGFVILRPHMFGVSDSREEMEALIHFWRVLGYLVGIKDEFNFCADSVDETYDRMNLIMGKVYRPALENTGEDFDYMTNALIDGLWHTDVLLSLKPVIFFTKRIAGCKGYEYFRKDFKKPPTQQELENLEYKKFTTWDRFLLAYNTYFYEYLYQYPVVRVFQNTWMYVRVTINYYLPILAIYQFGVRRAYVRIFRGKSTEPNKHIE